MYFILLYTRASSDPELKLFPNACMIKLNANRPKLLENSIIIQETAMHILLKTMLLFLPRRSATAPEGISKSMLVAWYIPSSNPI